MTHQVLARKYRPKRFDDVVGQPHVVRALSNALNQQQLHHAYLLTGIRGVGKTSIARILAKCLNCEKSISSTPCDTCDACTEIDAGRFPDLFEVDAASRTKVEDTRELLDNIQYAPTKGRFKVYLIDEVHMLSGHSFNALLKTLEEPPEHVKFLLATTDHQKLPATVLSRCLQFHLTSMTPEQTAERLRHILDAENIAFDAAATELLGRAATGSMRDGLSLLDQAIAYGNGEVRTAPTQAMLGTIEPTALYEILEALQREDGNALLSAVDVLAQQGADFSRALTDLLSLLHQIAVLQAVSTQEADNKKLAELAKLIPAEDIQLFYQIGLIGQRDLAFAPTPRSGFEMTVLRMLAFYPEKADEPKSTQRSQHNTPTPTAPVSRQATPAKVTSNDEWLSLLPHLQLKGAALALAQQCSFVSLTDSQLHLLLNRKQKPLLQEKQIQRLNEALTQHLQRQVSVKIELGEHKNPTPANIASQEKAAKQSAAEQSIIGDKQVQQIMQTFDATVVEGSVIPKEAHKTKAKSENNPFLSQTTTGDDHV